MGGRASPCPAPRPGAGVRIFSLSLAMKGKIRAGQHTFHGLFASDVGLRRREEEGKVAKEGNQVLLDHSERHQWDAIALVVAHPIPVSLVQELRIRT